MEAVAKLAPAGFWLTRNENVLLSAKAENTDLENSRD